MQEFKVGDKVYFPLQGTQIFTLSECNKYEGCPLSIGIGCYIYGFNNKGQGLLDQLPMLHHATPENCELLEKLHGVEFEKPPAKPTPKEIIQAMLDNGWKYVPCKTGSKHGINGKDLIFDYDDTDGYDKGKAYFRFLGVNGQYEQAIPFDPRTGEPITELPT